MPDPKSTVTDFLAALERLDIDGAVRLLADDVVYQNVPLRPARGITRVESQLRAMLRFCTGFEVRIDHMAAERSIVLTERTDVFRIRSWRAAFWVCGTFEVRDGRIVLWRDYFSWGTFLAASVRGLGGTLLSAAGLGRGRRR